MKARSLLILSVVAMLCLPAARLYAQQKLYRWVDDNGVVHYGDHVPPEFATTDRLILNEQAITVGFEEGEITPEERAEQERIRQAEEAAQKIRADIARRDRMLLETYLTVADIEDLRDRRLELLGSQIKVTELYLGNLQKRLALLRTEAAAYRPYSNDESAPELPENLALEISRTVASISLYEQTLHQTRDAQEELRAAFELDIERFKELKGG